MLTKDAKIQQYVKSLNFQKPFTWWNPIFYMLYFTDINGNDNDPMPQDNGDNKVRFIGICIIIDSYFTTNLQF